MKNVNSKVHSAVYRSVLTKMPLTCYVDINTLIGLTIHTIHADINEALRKINEKTDT